jgi:acetate kinase
MPEFSRRLPIPQELGLRRFGFHGLNYAYIASRLPELLGQTARGNIVIAHLGSGASLCMLKDLHSVDTTMGYTPAGGVVMGTRSGNLDPGVMLELSRRFDTAQLTDGESSEMSELLASNTASARFAVEYFCREVSGAIGALAAKAGGIDALVFTGGIGEHAASIRRQICAPLAFLGFALHDDGMSMKISTANSRPVLVVAADEEAMIQRLCLTLSTD